MVVRGIRENTVPATLAYIGLGSNLGDSRVILQDAWQTLDEMDGIATDGLSSPYLTAPVGMISQHWFTNAVGRLKVSLDPHKLLQAVLEVETLFGRRRTEKVFGYQDRSLDLDLLYFDQLQMDEPELTLPHPRRAERLFVVKPLAELEPDFVDYVTGSTVAEMMVRLTDRLRAVPGNEQEIVRGSWDG
jgi:2-amino-4-hydroxy-6-hydroxymethyldihydropteridine diphosphokinase